MTSKEGRILELGRRSQPGVWPRALLIGVVGVAWAGGCTNETPAGGDTGGAQATGGNTTGGATGGSATGGAATGGYATGGILATGGLAAGGAAMGGNSPATGGRATGGAAAGGAATGGTGTGGAAMGGQATGGKASGGTATGGQATGGKASGGTATGGQATGGKASGGTATGGAATGGTGHGICNFASGLNVAWVSFANDVPNPNIATFRTIFQNTQAAGGRVIRWWFHTNGTKTPGYNSSGLAQPLQQSHVDGIKSILSAANSAGVGINISLWSFDMLQSNAGNAYTNNKALLENDTNRQAYVDNYLTPLVNAIKGTPGLYSWEIFNEPEGMGPNGWATYRTTQAAIQKTVNWLAAAIHTADPAALVTNGAQTFNTCSTVSGKANWYSDSALRNAGGKQNGILDFYEVHYYSSNGTGNAPFGRAVTYWGLDKKVVIGEFDASTANNGVAAADTYTNLYTNNYSGAWAWSYNADFVWPSMRTPMQNLYNAHSDVGNCP
jgi:hypothetical protein